MNLVDRQDLWTPINAIVAQSKNFRKDFIKKTIMAIFRGKHDHYWSGLAMVGVGPWHPTTAGCGAVRAPCITWLAMLAARVDSPNPRDTIGTCNDINSRGLQHGPTLPPPERTAHGVCLLLFLHGAALPGRSLPRWRRRQKSGRGARGRAVQEGPSGYRQRPRGRPSQRIGLVRRFARLALHRGRHDRRPQRAGSR